MNSDSLRPPVSVAPDNQVSVVVVDDHEFMRELICARLEREGGRYLVVGHAPDAAGALEQCQSLRPDLLILDINLPDQKGTEIVPRIKQTCPGTRVLLCTAYLIEDPLDECLRVGANGFVEKTHTWDAFLEAVDRVSRGDRYFAATGSQANGAAGLDGKRHILEPKTPVTHREKEILALVADGLTSKDIARKLGVSVLTIDTHRANLMNKLGVRNVAGLVVFAVQSGIFTPKKASLRELQVVRP